MLDMFITIISSIVEIWACKKVFDYTSKTKTSLIKLNLSFLFSIFMVICIFYINIGANNRVWICILLTFIFYKLNYKVNPSKCLIVLFFYWMLLIGINALSMLLVVSINNLDSMNILLHENLYRYEAIFLGKFFLIILLYIYKTYHTNLKIGKKDIYICIPIIANLVSFFMLYDYIIDLTNISSDERVSFSVTVLLLTLSNISLFALIRLMLNIKNKKEML